MKIKVLICITSFFLLAFSANAQKVKIKKGYAIIDGEKYAKVERTQGNMSVYSLEDDEEIIYMKYMDPTPTNKNNFDSYYVVRFLDHNKEAEIAGSRKKILKMIYKGKLIQNGKIDEKRLDRFIAKYGSDESKNTVIIRN